MDEWNREPTSPIDQVPRVAERAGGEAAWPPEPEAGAARGQVLLRVRRPGVAPWTRVARGHGLPQGHRYVPSFLRSFVRPFVPEKGLESEQLIFSLLSTMYGWPFIPDGLFRWMDSFIHSFIHCAAFFFFYGQLVRLID